jgi:hypothetical protein
VDYRKWGRIMYFLIGLIIDGLLALIPANIAKNKGRNFARYTK